MNSKPRRVLQLALDGEQVEEPAEPASLRGVARGAPVLLQPAVDHRVDELRRELDVAVAQERDQVVLPRTLEGVLEVDDHQLAVGHHEVPALVVAVGEAPRRRGQPPRDPGEGPLELRPLRAGGSLPAPRLEAVLAEVVELPGVELLVEGAGEGEATRVGHRLRRGAHPGKEIHRPAVERLARTAVQRPLEGEVPQILEHHHRRDRVVAKDARHPDPEAVEVALDVEERQLLGGPPLLASSLLAGPGGITITTWLSGQRPTRR